ncbi:hypothetical protein GGI43DRAFT_237892 [Trichoderma evansii]
MRADRLILAQDTVVLLNLLAGLSNCPPLTYLFLVEYTRRTTDPLAKLRWLQKGPDAAGKETRRLDAPHRGISHTATRTPLCCRRSFALYRCRIGWQKWFNWRRSCYELHRSWSPPTRLCIVKNFSSLLLNMTLQGSVKAVVVV